jgi:hypothetical protein
MAILQHNLVCAGKFAATNVCRAFGSDDVRLTSMRLLGTLAEESFLLKADTVFVLANSNVLLFHREWLPSPCSLALPRNLAFHLPARTRLRMGSWTEQ